MKKTVIGITVVGKDREGIVATFTNFAFSRGGNIEKVNQNVIKNLFGMYLEVSFSKKLDVKKFDIEIQNLAKKEKMDVNTHHETNLEKNIAADIEKYLNQNGVENYQNLAGKTSISNLIRKIATLDLFITGDSGPMHIASALQIPTISIFGSTNDKETSQWKNDKSLIVKKNLECQPCMKRTCPLQHHDCMNLIKSKDVVTAVEAIIAD